MPHDRIELHDGMMMVGAIAGINRIRHAEMRYMFEVMFAILVGFEVEGCSASELTVEP